ncbi:hypothetical protein YTPLAS18_17010 [Nitrospira sp.]|nr:hypothetical protein YTPLAS18_17010 [Nitrospira sp.]
MRILTLLTVLLAPAFAFAQTSGQILDLGGGMSLYSDNHGNTGMIQNLGGGYSTFSGTQGFGSKQDLGGGFSTFSFTPLNAVPLRQGFQPPPQPPFNYMGPAQQLNQMNHFYSNQASRFR